MASTTGASAILHRSLEKEYPVAVGGEGVYLQTSDGRKILDGSSGAAVSCLGHGNEEVIDSICKQARQLSFAHTAFFTSDPAESLARLILDRSAGSFERVAFLTSGSEAIESALKIARQFHLYNGQPERLNVIGRLHSYHGNTLGALATGNNQARRSPFAPLLGNTFHHTRRCFFDADGGDDTEETYENGLISELDKQIAALGPETVAAVVVEPVVGSTLGSAPATAQYLPRLVALCRSHGILVIFDEVMCGLGRTGNYHAWQGLGNVAPDLQTIGKGLAGGYQPLSAVLIGPTVSKAFSEHSHGSQAFLSGHTFQGHAIACAAALTVQSILARDSLVERCKALGEVFRQALRDGLPEEWAQQKGSIRGLGLFQTLDFGNMKLLYGGPLAAEVARRAFALGAAVYLCSPAVDAILFCPPFVATEEEIKSLAGIALRALKDVVESRAK